MSDQKSIKIQVANRTYPLKIKAEQQVIIEKAAKLIAERIQGHEQMSGVKDMQDVLALCALQLAAEHIGLQNDMGAQEEEVNRELQELAGLIRNYNKH